MVTPDPMFDRRVQNNSEATARRSRPGDRWRRRSSAKRTRRCRPRGLCDPMAGAGADRPTAGDPATPCCDGLAPEAGRPPGPTVRLSGGRPTEPPVARPLSCVGHATLPPVLHHAPRRSRRCRDAVASTAPARGLPAPAGLGDLLAVAVGQAGQRPGRADHPRRAGRDRRPGDGDAGGPPGRRVAGERPLRRHRAGAGPLQGPRRPGHGAGDDPRRGRGDAAGRRREVVPPAADAWSTTSRRSGATSRAPAAG